MLRGLENDGFQMKSLKLFLAAAISVSLLGGCASLSKPDPYESLVNEPIPTSDSERDSECAWIAAEKSKKHLAIQYAAQTQPPMTALMWQAVAEKQIGYLDARKAQIQCDVIRVAPTAPVIPPKESRSSDMTIEMCVAKCRELTSRTAEQCFDSCRK